MPESPPRPSVWTRAAAFLTARDPDSARLAWVFLRLLGVVYFIAFASLWSQALGLMGEHGILPAQQYLDDVAGSVSGIERFRQYPTLLWISASDTAIQLVCGLGAGLAAALAVGVAPVVLLPLLWLLYLSLVQADALFLGYQWDGLLLETGFAAVFLAPWGWWPRPAQSAPPRVAMFVLRWVLFRVFFLSAVVKWLAHTNHWRNYCALTHHYQTQPLPNPLSHWVHNLPDAVHEIGALATVLIEGPLALLVLAPRPWRRLAFLPLAGLQLMIGLSGNYGFFNLLTLLLCLLVLDGPLPHWLKRWRSVRPVAETRKLRRGVAAALVVVLLLQLGLGSLYLWNALSKRERLPDAAVDVVTWFGPWQIVNNYGLFADMTSRRPEIRIEGSLDGHTWREYGFSYKPGPLDGRPRWAGFHMPRLDWQMWFAALAYSCENRRGRWYQALARRLLQASPEVLELFESDPFQGEPPRYLRTTLWDYRFTNRAELAETGSYWEREYLGEFCPVLTLHNGRLAATDLEPEPTR